VWWWLHNSTRLSISVGPPNAHHHTWWAFRYRVCTHPGNWHPSPSRTRNAVIWESVANRRERPRYMRLPVRSFSRTWTRASQASRAAGVRGISGPPSNRAVPESGVEVHEHLRVAPLHDRPLARLSGDVLDERVGPAG